MDHGFYFPPANKLVSHCFSGGVYRILDEQMLKNRADPSIERQCLGAAETFRGPHLRKNLAFKQPNKNYTESMNKPYFTKVYCTFSNTDVLVARLSGLVKTSGNPPAL